MAVVLVLAGMMAGAWLNSVMSPGRGDGGGPVPSVIQAADTAQVTATSTMLSTSAASPVPQGTPLTLTATLTPNTAAGTVQFKDGGANIGSPASVKNGTASSAATLAVGPHQLSAVFTPTDPKKFGPSTSPPVPFTVAGATPTTTSLTASSTTDKPVQGSPVALMATVNPSAATGTIQFRDGATNLGQAAVSKGTATLNTTKLGMGSRQLSAEFTPANANLYQPSTSSPVTFVISDKDASDVTLATDPTSPVIEGTPITMTASITPAEADGRVQFRDGNTDIGKPVKVNDGKARENATLGVGSHQLTAVFTPTNTALFRSSTSAPKTYVVRAKPVLNTDLALVPNKKDPPGDRGPRDNDNK